MSIDELKSDHDLIEVSEILLAGSNMFIRACDFRADKVQERWLLNSTSSVLTRFVVGEDGEAQQIGTINLGFVVMMTYQGEVPYKGF